MFLNTRNFVLYLLCVGFLLVAITVTLTATPDTQVAAVAHEAVSVTEPEEYEVEAGEAVVNREERLITMREQVAKRGVVAEVTSPVETEVLPIKEEEVLVTDEPLICPSYTTVTTAWNPGPVTFAVVEGARMMYRADSSPVTPSTSTSTKVVPEALLQLPLRSLPLPVVTCLNTDVVGVALDGSLIRNNELGLYTVFEAQTLIGYALDGFPIYGAGAQMSLDTCGGALVEGQYRYHLEYERGGILNCFAGIPVDL